MGRRELRGVRGDRTTDLMRNGVVAFCGQAFGDLHDNGWAGFFLDEQVGGVGHGVVGVLFLHLRMSGGRRYQRHQREMLKKTERWIDYRFPRLSVQY